MASSPSDSCIAVIVNQTSVDLTHYVWYNKVFPWEDNFNVQFSTIHPGESLVLYVDYFGMQPMQACKNKDGTFLLIDGRKVTKVLIAKCSDVGAFYDVPSTASTHTATIFMDARYTRIDVYETAAGKLTADPPATSDQLPDVTPGLNWDIPVERDDEKTDLTEHPNMGEDTQGNPTDTGNPFDQLSQWFSKYGPWIAIGGVSLFVLLLLILIKR